MRFGSRNGGSSYGTESTTRAGGSESRADLVLERQEHRELGEHVGLRVDGDQAAVQLDQAARDVEAEAGRVGAGGGVVLRRLRVEERLEDPLPVLLRDADAVVAHAQARPAARVALARRLVDVDRDLAVLGRVADRVRTRG